MMTITMMSSSDRKKVVMNFFAMYQSILRMPSICQILRVICSRVLSFQAAKSPASMCVRAVRTRSR